MLPAPPCSGPTAQLEGILSELQRRLVAIDGEESDVGTALACAALLQTEAAEAAPPADCPASTASGSSVLVWAAQVCRAAAAVGAGCMPAAAPPAQADEVGEALHWARFATAAYGARQHLWRRGKTGPWAARRQLSRLAAAAAAEGAQPLAGWGGEAAPAGGKPHKACGAERKSFAAARDLLGAGSQIVALSSGDERRGLLPHVIAVDSEKQAVVLGIGGSWQWPHTIPEAAPLPAGWLASGSAAAAEEGGAAPAPAVVPGLDGTPTPATSGGKSGGGSWVHKQSLEAAQALLAELHRSQLLQQLLQPAARSSGPMATLDCHGWRVVVAGHGVGGSAAALLAPKLAGWHLGPLEVWCFGAPGELCSPDVAAAISACGRLTAAAVGDDTVPRTSAAGVAALVDQAVVGLARLRWVGACRCAPRPPCTTPPARICL